MKNFFKNIFFPLFIVFISPSFVFAGGDYVSDINSLFRIMSGPSFSSEAMDRLTIRLKEGEEAKEARLIMIGEDHFIAQDILDNFYFLNRFLKKEYMKDRKIAILFEGSGYSENNSIQFCSLFFLSRVLASVNRSENSSLIESDEVFAGVLRKYKDISKLKYFRDFNFSSNVECNFWDDQKIIDWTIDALRQGKKITSEEFKILAKRRDQTLLRVVKDELAKNKTVIVIAGVGHLPIERTHHLFEAISELKHFLVYH